MNIYRKIGPKGQIILPKNIRELLGVQPGDQIIIEITQNEVKIRPKKSIDEYLKKFLDTPKKLDKKIEIESILDER